METIVSRSKYHQMLLDDVEKATCIEDIQSLLNFLGVDTLKPLIQNQIRLLNTRDAHAAVYETQSITDILHDDVIQHVLSFDMHPDSQLVCKKWHKQIHSLKILFERQRQMIVEQQTFVPVIPSLDLSTTWVVHPTPNTLTDREIELGYKGPMKCVFDALESYDSGDTLLVHPGQYEYTRTQNLPAFNQIPPYVVMDKDVQIIGVGSKVNTVIDMQIVGRPGTGIMCSGNANIYLRNITIMSNNHPCGFVIDHASVWMENCCYFDWPTTDFNPRTFGLVGGIPPIPDSKHISVQEGSTLNLKNCVLSQSIDMVVGSKVTSLGCTFGYSSKLLDIIRSRYPLSPEPGADLIGIIVDHVVGDEKDEPVTNGELMCIGNVFIDTENNQKYPIISRNVDSNSINVVSRHNIWMKKEKRQCIIAAANEIDWYMDDHDT
eukprot:173511_1